MSVTDDLLRTVKYSVNEFLQRRSLSVYAARELLAAAEAIERWLDGEGPNDDDDRRVERFRGAVEALRCVERSRP